MTNHEKKYYAALICNQEGYAFLEILDSDDSSKRLNDFIEGKIDYFICQTGAVVFRHSVVYISLDEKNEEANKRWACWHCKKF